MADVEAKGATDVGQENGKPLAHVDKIDKVRQELLDTSPDAMNYCVTLIVLWS